VKISAPVKRDALLAVCSLAPPARPDSCAWCGAARPPLRRTWCSDRCGDAFWANHWWSVARTAAKRRDRYRCRQCGARNPKRPAEAAYTTRAAYLAAMRAWRAAKKVARLEVNHIDPCLGKHGQLSCAHHLVNLETLCARCHKLHTAALRTPPSPAAERVASKSPSSHGSRPNATRAAARPAQRV